ncbi:MAG TPA: hypothetical protein VN541_18070 [Tepidisphaeraceae bacterium]|nr:hypothetical protein [Tepidisphaeraceae bacterium]
MYYLCLASLFAVIAFYIVPNVYLFGRPYGLGPADFVAETQDPYNIAAVRAIKRFQKVRGKLPKDYRDVVPAYIPANVWKGNILNGDFITYSYGGPAPVPHAIIYRFAPGVEGWWVEGSFAYGKIPVPPVSLEGTRLPSTQAAR